MISFLVYTFIYMAHQIPNSIRVFPNGALSPTENVGDKTRFPVPEQILSKLAVIKGGSKHTFYGVCIFMKIVR